MRPDTAPTSFRLPSRTATGWSRRALSAHSAANGVSGVAVSQPQSASSPRTAVSMTAEAVSTRERSTSWMKEAT